MSLDERMYMMRVPAEQCGELKEKPISVNRTAKVVKGGRRFGFSAFVISGDGASHVGYGHGKASEVPDAVRKANEGARKNLIKVALRGSTVAHEVTGKFGGTKVILKPAEPGTGVIAGPVVRAIVEAAGIKDIRTKVIGSSNAINVLYATFDAFTKIREPERVAQLRGLTLEELGYAPY